MSSEITQFQRWLDYDGTPEGQPRRPEYRHGTVIPQRWSAIVFNPVIWKAGHWALFGAILTGIADLITLLYVANFFGVGHDLEIEIWLVISGVIGFLTITAALWAIWKNRARTAGIWALAIGFVLGAPPAWLVGNTIVQLILNGGTLPAPEPTI